MREQAIWQILYKIIDACEFLESMGLYHGDIRLSNIFITDVDIKLCVSESINRFERNFPLFQEC
jgi:serine/threonine protein kinase